MCDRLHCGLDCDTWCIRTAPCIRDVRVFVLQVLPGVSAMDGVILNFEANGGSNEPVY